MNYDLTPYSSVEVCPSEKSASFYRAIGPNTLKDSSIKPNITKDFAEDGTFNPAEAEEAHCSMEFNGQSVSQSRTLGELYRVYMSSL
jgi:hypothetical protein